MAREMPLKLQRLSKSRVHTVCINLFGKLCAKMYENKSDNNFNSHKLCVAVSSGKVTPTIFCSDVPDAPKNLECIEAFSNAIGLEWAPPRRDGGAPVRGYIVERRQGYSSRFIPVNKGFVLDNYFRDTSVYDGQEYEYRIVAENEAGQSEPSRPIGPIAARQPFSK